MPPAARTTKAVRRRELVRFDVIRPFPLEIESV
jgi:hypothetical protein